ncbi:MAG TPA: cytochrome c3 family protein [Nitrospirota bacterium]|nr:cytochrome c3 family protein [Nitrospirota bacterium]
MVNSDKRSVRRGKQAYALFLLSVCFLLFFPVFLRPLAAAAAKKAPAKKAASTKVNCLTCHRKLTKGKSVHQALAMGCPTCHVGINSMTFPHKKTNALAKGLSSEQPDLCYGCHDPGMFSKKVVHPALGMGCTSCHDPHSSPNIKLLKSLPPSLCFTCHDNAGFTRKTVHPPVAAGECLTCHAPHASDEMALLPNKPVEVCLMCHGDVDHWPHFFSQTAAQRQDPTRPGKPFYCGSCHNPHSTTRPGLVKFNSEKFCVHCHIKG